MKKAIVLIMVIFLSVSIISCGGKKDANDNDAAQDLNTGEAVAMEIGKHYDNSMNELQELLKAQMEPAPLKEKIQALKDKYIAIYVEIGKQREKLSEGEKNKCNSKLWSEMGKMDKERMKYIIDKNNEYNKIDFDIAKLISDMNILQQYAQFELLKKQEPKEAERLGIK